MRMKTPRASSDLGTRIGEWEFGGFELRGVQNSLGLRFCSLVGDFRPFILQAFVRRNAEILVELPRALIWFLGKRCVRRECVYLRLGARGLR